PPAVEVRRAPEPPALPVESRAYHQFYRTPSHAWWKPLAVVALVVGGAFHLSIGLSLAGIVVDLLTGRLEVADLQSFTLSLEPGLFTANNLVLAALIPLGMLAQWAVYGQTPRWLSSVQGGLRWRWLAICTAVTLPVLLAVTVVELVLNPVEWVGTDVVLWLVLVLLTTPLQAAGEEYGLRGTLNRAVAAWVSDPRVSFLVGAVVSSVVFMFLHAALDPWLNVYYFCFGMLACVLCWRTGGLEAAIALHVVNNVISFVVTILAGQMDSTFERGVGTASPAVLIQVLVLALTTVLIDRIFARTRMRRITAPGAPNGAGETGSPSPTGYAPA
ncbi:CPBP family intramembrane glutamic endopeptidase, partial [Desertihabitans aurantiacus]|uniref:CPBP family intramembrane glutamic endopeptidase n=1 Tax=Desertihabitans aurantiacus TaxID=2282477 RepID=UPI00130031BC